METPKILTRETKQRIFKFVTEESHLQGTPLVEQTLGYLLLSTNPKIAEIAERVIMHYDHLWHESEQLGKPWWFIGAMTLLYQARSYDTGDLNASDPRSNVAHISQGRSSGNNGLKRMSK